MFLNLLCFGNLCIQFWTGVCVESEAWWWNNRVLCKSIAGFIVATESIFTPLLGTLKTHWGLGVRFKPSENAARDNVFWRGLTTESAKVSELTWNHPQSQCHSVDNVLAFMYKLSWMNPMHRIVWKLSAIWNAWNSIVGKTYSAEMQKIRKCIFKSQYSVSLLFNPNSGGCGRCYSCSWKIAGWELFFCLGKKYRSIIERKNKNLFHGNITQILHYCAKVYVVHSKPGGNTFPMWKLTSLSSYSCLASWKALLTIF